MKRRGAQAHREGNETVHSDGWQRRGESNEKGSAVRGRQEEAEPQTWSRGFAPQQRQLQVAEGLDCCAHESRGTSSLG